MSRCIPTMLALIAQGIISLALLWALQWLYTKSDLDNIPGPARQSFIKGNLGQLLDISAWEFNAQLAERRPSQEATQDVESRILDCPHAPYEYENQLSLQLHFTDALFSPQVPMFNDVAKKLEATIRSKLTKGAQEIDILHWMGRAALEMIGQSGLGYSFDSLEEGAKPHPFSEATKAFSSAMIKLILFRDFLLPTVIKIGSPRFRRWVVDHIPMKNLHAVRDIVDTWDRTTVEIFEGKKRALAEGDKALAKQVGQAKDLMSILMKANMKASDEDRLPDSEVLGQLGPLNAVRTSLKVSTLRTITFAAVDTTSNALSRTLHLLAMHPEIQDRLREELTQARKANTGDMSYDDLVSLSFLDAVCRETLRLARQDAILPLSTPIKGVDGREMDSILVPKGTKFFVSILNINRDPSIWGPDSLEWKPERWLTPLPDTVHNAQVPGIYSHLLTFLGGGRSCIGFKFSQLEMTHQIWPAEVVLATLVSQFCFYPPEKEIVWKLTGITIPIVKGSTGKPQLPLKMEVVNTRLTATWRYHWHLARHKAGLRNHRYDGPMIIAKVCKRWRTIALATPLLWSSIGVYCDGNRSNGALLKAWLERSGTHPLMLYIREYDNRQRTHGGQNPQPDPVTEDIMSMLVAEARQWRTVHSHFTLQMSPTLVSNLRPYSLKILRSARFHVGHFYERLRFYPLQPPTAQQLESMICMWDAFHSSPALRIGEWQPAYLSWEKALCSVPWIRLTTLYLRCSISRLSGILPKLQRLEELHFTEFGDGHQRTPNPNSVVIVLPRLRTLSIHAFITVDRVFQPLALPSLNAVEIRCNSLSSRYPQPSTAVVDFFSRSQCAVRALVNADTIYGEDTLLGVLSSTTLPSLIELKVNTTAMINPKPLLNLERFVMEQCTAKSQTLVNMVVVRMSISGRFLPPHVGEWCTTEEDIRRVTKLELVTMAGDDTLREAAPQAVRAAGDSRPQSPVLVHA
ncbi:hypothetical protein DXG01_012523 [Tephrocybe rancida]|nr:hypothetical protein DXG01_012523 [Tephrocybe rancida]